MAMRVKVPEKPVWGRKCNTGRHPMDPTKLFLPYKERPLRLKNSVLGAGKNLKDAPCVPEMMKLFDCLQKYDHDQANCGQLVNTFQECYNGHLSALAAKKKGFINAEPVVGSRKLSTEQINTLLARHPQR